MVTVPTVGSFFCECDIGVVFGRVPGGATAGYSRFDFEKGCSKTPATTPEDPCWNVGGESGGG